MESLSLFVLIVIFLISAAVTWIAGISLTKTTDIIDTRLNIGEALGGLILLGISGSLPEIAICYSAAISGHIPIIIGNLLGGIAIQTLIIVIFDFSTKQKKPLSYIAGSPLLSLETIFAIFITSVALGATFIPVKKSIFHMNPLSIFLAVIWVVGLFTINRARKNPKYFETSHDGNPGRKHHQRRAVENHAFYTKKSTLYVSLIFLVGCVATLIAGVVLEESGSIIADKLGLNSGIFAATVLAICSSLPEISTGLESIFIGDNHLAVSDIMGGNAFMLVIFLFADFIVGKPVLSYAGHIDILFGIVGIFMMAVYAASFLLKPQKCYLGIGPDSIIQIVLYTIGLVVMYYFI